MYSLFQKQKGQSASRHTQCLLASAGHCLQMDMQMDMMPLDPQTSRDSQCSLAGALDSAGCFHVPNLNQVYLFRSHQASWLL